METLPALEPDNDQTGRMRVLQQDRFWWDVDDRRWPLELMSLDYLENACRSLEAQAWRLYQLEIARAPISDGMLEATPADLDPLDWVRSTVLYRAIRCRISDWPRLERPGS